MIEARATPTGRAGTPPSAGIVLAPLRAEDSDLLYQWINDRQQVIYNAPYRPVSRADHDQWFESIRHRDDVAIFGIRQADSDRLIGTCQLRNIDPLHRTAELQIRIGDVSQRERGFGTAAIEQLLNYGFRQSNLHRISLEVFEDNERARKAYLKTGFREEGLLREAVLIEGEYKSVQLMGILKNEYDRRHPPA